MLYKIVHNPCYFLSHIITPRPNVSQRTDRKRHELVRSVADIGLLQEQCHACLGSNLTKPCLPCVVTSKTAAIHVGWQHNMCNFLGCKILQGSHPAAWDQEGLPSRQKNLPDAYWSIKERHTPFTMNHPMHLPTKTNVPSIYMPCTFQQPSLMHRLFFWNETAIHLPFTYVAVPGRNRTLFRCIFRLHCCVRSTVAQNFR